jgi:hypothetical protein
MARIDNTTAYVEKRKPIEYARKVREEARREYLEAVKLMCQTVRSGVGGACSPSSGAA